MKLVCLEILIVSIATRAILALLGKPPPLPDIVWACVTLVTGLAAVLMLVGDLVAQVKQTKSVRPPYIPLERIGPYRPERIEARDADRGRYVSLN